MLALALALSSAAGPARAELQDPASTGVLIVSTSSLTALDPRLGTLAAGFVRRGLESVVAADLARPAPDPEPAVRRARRALEEARAARHGRRSPASAAAIASASDALEAAASEPGHLALLLELFLERALLALGEEDLAAAETLFLRAIALDPTLELDSELYPREALELFSDVRRASRQLPYGSLSVEAPAVPGASVSVDFGPPCEAPCTHKLPDGRHFVSVSAPGRQPLVALVPVRPERRAELVLRPALAGDPFARSQAVSALGADDPGSVAALAGQAGLRFVVIASLTRTNVQLTLHDGRTGLPVVGGDAVLSVVPAPAEVDAAVTKLLGSASALEPDVAPDEGAPWYTRWWVVGLLGLAAAGAAASVVVLERPGLVEYTFDP